MVYKHKLEEMSDCIKELYSLAWGFTSVQFAHYISQQPYNSKNLLSTKQECQANSIIQQKSVLTLLVIAISENNHILLISCTLDLFHCKYAELSWNNNLACHAV